MSSIDFVDETGATVVIDDPDFGEMAASYAYWDAEIAPAGVSGWYPYDDDGSHPRNDVQIKLGEAYIVSCYDGEEGAKLVYSGAVYDQGRTFEIESGFNWLGNCAPKDITIKDITAKTGAQIDIEEDKEKNVGIVTIYATSPEMLEAAKKRINALTAEAEPGKIYDGVVTGIKEFGAFVEILPGLEGLCHISELSDKRVPNVEAVCKVGDKMRVMCIGVDEQRGRIKLSRREAMKVADEQAQA